MPVAIVTGAASGIGLALSRQFKEQGWNVALGDVDVPGGERAAEELGDQTFFHRVDVSDWDDVASLFKKTIERFGRIDYVAANAGVADCQSIYDKHEGEPQKPNLKTIDIDLSGQIYCLYLAAHYFRKNGGDGGTVVFTSSNAGLYKLPTNPQYSAAKYGIVGLVRSTAPVFQKENIRVNCICPAFVPTNLSPEPLLKAMPSEHLTPMSTIMRGFDNFASDSTLVGKVAECSQGNIFYREQAEYCDESSRWHGEESSKLWDAAYN